MGNEKVKERTAKLHTNEGAEQNISHSSKNACQVSTSRASRAEQPYRTAMLYPIYFLAVSEQGHLFRVSDGSADIVALIIPAPTPFFLLLCFFLKILYPLIMAGSDFLQYLVH